VGKVSFFAGDLARQTAFDSILGHVNGQGVGHFSALCPFVDSQWAQREKNSLILSRMAGKYGKWENNGEFSPTWARRGW